jgi:hypothetical protein
MVLVNASRAAIINLCMTDFIFFGSMKVEKMGFRGTEGV